MTLEGPFQAGQLEDWTFSGSAVVTDSFIRLTPAEAGHEGSIWSKGLCLHTRLRRYCDMS